MPIMARLIRIAVVISLVLTGATLRARQNFDDLFEQFTVENGLPSNTIQVLFQDRSGFLWIGTDTGLARYDGIEFRIYPHDPKNENSPSSDQITSLQEDQDGIIWVGTTKGVNGFQPRQDRWNRYLSGRGGLSQDMVTSLWVDTDSSLWIGTEGGAVSRFSPRTRAWERYHGPNDAKWDYIKVIRGEKEGSVWLGTLRDGLIHFRPDRGTWDNHRSAHHIGNEQNINPFNKITTLTTIPGSGVLAGSDAGLEWFTAKGDRPEIPFPIGNLPPGKVSALLRTTTGDLWVSIENHGLWRFSRESNRWQNWGATQIISQGVTKLAIETLIEDRSGCIWIGTKKYGLVKYDPRKSIWNNLKIPSSLVESAPEVLSLLEDRKKTLWIGTSGSGLLECGKNRSDWTEYQSGGEGTLAHNLVFALHQDQGGNIWAGTWRGLCRFSPRTKSWKTFRARPEVADAMENKIRAIAPGDNQSLLIATWGRGLFRFFPETGTWEHCPLPVSTSTDVYVEAMVTDRTGSVWLGINTIGLTQFNPFTRKWANFPIGGSREAAHGNRVHCLCEDRRSSLWIGTDTGLYRLLPDRQTWQQFTTSDGLADNKVFGLVADDRGFLWVFTERGLSQIDPQSDRIRSFNTRDGMRSIDFWSNANAFQKGQDGTILFSWQDHVTDFDPAKTLTAKPPPVIAITDFRIFDQPSLHLLSVDNRMQLSYKRNFITIKFAVLDFSKPAQNQYAYKIDELHRDWIQLGNRSDINLSDLKPGRFTFRIKGANDDGVWGDAETVLHLYMVPPFWKTIWFYLLLLVGAIVVIVGAHTWRVRNLKNRQVELENQVDERTKQLCLAFVDLETVNRDLQNQIKNRIGIEAALKETNIKLTESLAKLRELDQMKTDFFTTTSHELRTPLTSVIGFARIIRRKFADTILPSLPREADAKTAKTIQQVQQNMEIIVTEGERLTKLINDLLDIARIESGKMEWKKERIAISDVIEGAARAISSLFEEKRLHLHIDQGDRPMQLLGDRDRLKQVLINLLSNSVKFTPPGGEISIIARYCPAFAAEEKASLHLDEIEIAVRDNGSGIPTEARERLFEKFFQIGSKNEETIRGSGLGLYICRQIVGHYGGRIWVESELGKGSTFTIRIPVDFEKTRELTARIQSTQAELIRDTAKDQPI